MNIKQAKQIPLRNVVEHLGGKFSHETAKEIWFRSPFRPNERTASFKINNVKNTWHDFGRTEKLDAHGDIIDLYTDYYNMPRRHSDSIKQALKDLQQFSSLPVHMPPIVTPKETAPRYTFIKQPQRIWHESMKEELDRRGIRLQTVQSYLKQAYIVDNVTQKKYNGFAFENDEGGFEISIPNPKMKSNFKTCIGKKAISSSIVGHDRTLLVFEGFWDMYTWVEMNPDKKQNLRVLNSVSLVNELIDVTLRDNQFDLVIAFMNNDEAGEKATYRLADEFENSDIRFGTMNHLYEGYKDLNDFWTQCPTARQYKPKIETAKYYSDTAWDHVRKSRPQP